MGYNLMKTTGFVAIKDMLTVEEKAIAFALANGTLAQVENGGNAVKTKAMLNRARNRR